MLDAMKKLAAEDGYELAYGEQSHGSEFFGLQIYVKMSNRKLCDGDTLYSQAEAIRAKLDTVSAERDPERELKLESYRKEIERVYMEAGVTSIFMERLPNGYCSKPCCLLKPWFRVTSSIGHVVIGWRKNVISIEWGESTVGLSGNELFPNENVTRWETGIHAWGGQMAAVYVRRLHQHLPKKDAR